MKNNKDILNQVLNRAEEIKEEKRKTTLKIQRTVCIASGLILTISLSFMMPYIIKNIDTNSVTNHSGMGTFFASSSYLGYIIIGIIAFVLGIAVTLVCYKLKNKK